MGIFNELKRVLFGAKAVTKHQAEQAKEVISEKKDELFVETEKILEDLTDEFEQKKESAKVKSEEVKTKIKEEAKEIWDKTKEKSSEILEDIQESEAYQKTTETFDKVGDVVLDTGEKFYDKTKEILEGPGKEMAEMAKDISEEIGAKIKTTSKNIMDKSKDVAEDLGDRFDKTFQKAQDEAELEKMESKEEFADTPIDTGGSTLEGQDSFFDKAEKFAKGEYSDKPRILDEKITSKIKNTTKDLPGFKDNDGDGDDLIDDAEIVEDQPEK